MKKQILAIAIAAASFTATTQAAEIYKNELSTLSLGGHVSVNLNGSEKGSTTVESVSPRINIEATQKIGNGYTVDAKAEWRLNMLDGGEETFTTRLGYLGLSHKDLGRLVAGTQWAPYYDVAGAADMPIAFANDFIYDNHGVIGTGRADKMVSYRHDYAVGNVGINFGFGFQGKNGTVDERFQVSTSADYMGASLGFAMTTGDIDALTAESQVFSLKYGKFGQGLYLAAVHAMNENINSDGMGGVLADSHATELLAAYGPGKGLNLIANYELVDGEDAVGTEYTTLEQMAVQVEYKVTSNVVTFAGYQFDLNDKNGRDTDDMWTIGARVYL
ncbi:porin [Vibrio owensii]|uniref:porin n=1 Tax=Vibrio owensii TaxID=696485 RepID=UPI0018F19F85|nr:porin [Vibrio owensii]